MHYWIQLTVGHINDSSHQNYRNKLWLVAEHCEIKQKFLQTKNYNVTHTYKTECEQKKHVHFEREFEVWNISTSGEVAKFLECSSKPVRVSLF